MLFSAAPEGIPLVGMVGQVFPPSVVSITFVPPVIAQMICELSTEALVRVLTPDGALEVHVTPAFLVVRTLPSSPTAIALFWSVAVIARRFGETRGYFTNQWTPPSFVSRIVPESPTVQPINGETGVVATDRSLLPVGSGFCQHHPKPCLPVEHTFEATTFKSKADTAMVLLELVADAPAFLLSVHVTSKEFTPATVYA
jgi:hypothetical protein